MFAFKSQLLIFTQWKITPCIYLYSQSLPEGFSGRLFSYLSIFNIDLESKGNGVSCIITYCTHRLRSLIWCFGKRFCPTWFLELNDSHTPLSFFFRPVVKTTYTHFLISSFLLVLTFVVICSNSILSLFSPLWDSVLVGWRIHTRHIHTKSNIERQKSSQRSLINGPQLSHMQRNGFLRDIFLLQKTILISKSCRFYYNCTYTSYYLRTPIHLVSLKTSSPKLRHTDECFSRQKIGKTIFFC